MHSVRVTVALTIAAVFLVGTTNGKKVVKPTLPPIFSVNNASEKNFVDGDKLEYIMVFDGDDENVDASVDDAMGKLSDSEEGDGAAPVAKGSNRCKPNKAGKVPKNCPSQISIGNFKAVMVTTSNGEAVRNLRKFSGVKYIQESGKVHLDACTASDDVGTSGTNSRWGLDHIDVDADEDGTRLNGKYTYNADHQGEGVNIYVIDSGIRKEHEDFGGRASFGAKFCNWPCVNWDKFGHGTWVAGVAAGKDYGVAKKANLIAVKIISDWLHTTVWRIIQGLEWARDHDVQKKKVINMSLAVLQNNAFDAAVNAVVDEGIPVVVAAGNNNFPACWLSPANAEKAITVGSIKSNQVRSEFSNWGDCLDIFAPGSNVQTTAHWNNVDTVSKSGTSLAAPHVAGSIAVFLSEQEALGNTCTTPTDIRKWLIDNAVDGVGSPWTDSPDLMLQLPCSSGCPL